MIRDDYIPGTAKRKALKGYPQYRRYAFGDIFVDRIDGKEDYRDYLAEKWVDSDLGPYYDTLKSYFSDLEKLDEKTDEEIYGDIHKLRKRYLGPIFFEKIRENRIDKLKSSKYTPEEKGLYDAFLDIVFYNESKRELDTPIKRWDIFTERVINTSTPLIVIPGHYLELYPLLYFLSRIQDIRKREIILILKNESIYNEPTGEDIIYLDTDLDLRVYTYEFEGVGLNLRFLTNELKGLLNDAKRGKYEILAFGETMLFSLHGALFPYFIATKVKRVTTRIYTNIQPDEPEAIPYVFSYISGNSLPAEDFLGMERVKKTLFHFEKTKGKDSALLSYYFNFYSTTFSPERFPAFKIEDEKGMIDVLRKRDMILSDIIDDYIRDDEGARYIKTYYDLEKMEKTAYPIGSSTWENGVLVTGMIFGDLKRLRFRPILAEDLGYGTVSPRTLIKRGIIGGKDLFYFNFLYFFTKKLIGDYNYIRKGRPHEVLEDKEFFLGYRYIPGKEYETFPLYNKGFFGYTKDGHPIFGRRTLEGGKIDINGLELSWDKKAVNPEKDGEFSIYTPFTKNNLLAKKNIDFMRFSYPVGEDRFNMIIVNDRIVSIREGDVLLSPVGVVLSFSRKSRYVKILKDILSLKEKDNGYISIGTSYKVKIRLDPPEGISSKMWKEIEWIYGGGTLLVDRGKNLVETEDMAYETFMKEGWYHPLSMQTQETQVQKWGRGPRNIIGVTDRDEFFVMTFSGRTKESRGINFGEGISIIERELNGAKISYAMNLDGGSSVCLGLIHKGEFFELNYPAPSPTTPSGMVRPVNSMIVIGV